MEPVLPPAICIAGHHRSGTSLFASMCERGGLDIGRDLLPPAECNRKGFFEDVEFLSFHINVLNAVGLHKEGLIVDPVVSVPADHVPVARRLIETRRAAGRMWGWKEPRTVLFLDFWADLIPELRFVFLFRAPWEVLDSLYRRGDLVFQAHPGLAPQVWMNYNRAMLAFADRHPERCAIIETTAAVADPAAVTRAMRDRFGAELRPDTSVYDPTELVRDAGDGAAVLAAFCPEAIEVYGQMQRRADLAVAPSALPRHPDAGFRDWQVARWAGKQLAAATARLQQQQEDHHRTLETTEARTRHELVQAAATTEAWSAAQDSAAAGWAEAARLGGELAWAKAVAARSADENARRCEELHRASQQLRTALAELAWMRSSRFWKARQAVVGIRRAVGGLLPGRRTAA